MSPAKLSLSMVASPQSPLPFHLAKSLYLCSGTAQTSMAVPAAAEVAAAGEPLPACDRGPHGSQPVVQPAYLVETSMCQCWCGCSGCSNPDPFTRGLALPSRQQPRLPQHSPSTRRAHRHHLCIQHHERQPPIALQRILQMKIDDGFLLPRLQPEIAGNPTVVLIHSPVALSPVVKLAGRHAQPLRESSDADLGPLRPTSDKIYYLIPHIMRHPALGQSSPRLFFNATCSAISSTRTSSLVWTFFSKNSIRFCFSST